MKEFRLLSVVVLLAVVSANLAELNKVHELTELEKLDDFNLMNILDMLPLNDLVKIGSLNPRFSQLIAQHYIAAEYSLHKRELYLMIDDVVTIKASSVGAPFPIDINEYETVLSALQQFGHIFGYLDIRIRSSGYEYLDKIQSFVNKYCSNALLKIMIARGHDDNSSVDFSFVNATSVFLVDRNQNRTDPIPLHTAFPLMKQLSIDANMPLNHHYSHLVQVILHTAVDLTDFWRLNPQLRRIDAQLSNDPAYFHKLNEWIPNLESLSLLVFPVKYNFDTLPIARFKSMKRFSLSTHRLEDSYFSIDRLCDIFNSIRFDQLESFSLLSSRLIALGSVVKMITENSALKYIHLSSELSFEQFSAVIASLPELKQLTFSWYERSTRHTLKTMLEHVITSNHGLKNITINIVPYISTINSPELLEFIPNGWTTNEESWNYQPLQLERSE